MGSASLLSPGPRSWSLFPWTTLLVALFVGTTSLTWHRTLIGDEILYLLNAGRPLSDQLETLRLDLTHPPLMYLVERVWMNAFGHTDDSVKILVALLASSSIVLFSILARLVMESWRLAAFLFCTAVLQVGGVPTLARGYSLGLVLATGSLLIWELWRRRPTATRLVGWTIVMLLFVHTHYVGLLLVPPFVAVNSLYGHRRWSFAAAAALVGLSFVPWFVWVIPVYQSRGLDYNIAWVEPNVWKTVAKLPFHFLTYLPAGWDPFGMNDWPRTNWLRTFLVGLALLVHGLLIAFAWRRLKALWPPTSSSAAAMPWFWSSILIGTFPIAVLVVVSWLVQPALDARFISFLLPLYWLGIVLLVDLRRRAGRAVLYAVFVPWVAVAVAVPFARNVGGSTIHRTLRTVAGLVRPTDLILCERMTGMQVYWEWTRSLQRSERILIVSDSRQPKQIPPLPRVSVDEIPPGDVARVWVITTGWNPGAFEAIRASLMGRGFQVDDSIRLAFLTLFTRDTVRTPANPPR